MANFETSEAFSPKERLVLRLAIAMSSAPASVDETLITELRAHFDEGQLVELAATIAWENYRARFNRAFAISPENFSEGAVCALPERKGSPAA